MKELFEAINTRVKEPYWGFFLLSFLAFNWRGLFLLCFATGTAQHKINLFDSETNFWSLLFFPIATSLIILLITPWLKVLFGYVSRSAYERINSQELKRESKYLAEKNTLERERVKALANKENELIDQVKRDIDIEKIEDEKLRENLKREIDELRKDHLELANSKNSNLSDQQNLSSFEREILVYLSKGDNNFISKENIYNTGLIIDLGSKRISKSESNREYLKYEEAVYSLIDKKIIYDLRNEGKVFELTDYGRNFISQNKNF